MGKAKLGLTKAFIERWPSYGVTTIDRFHCNDKEVSLSISDSYQMSSTFISGQRSCGSPEAYPRVCGLLLLQRWLQIAGHTVSSLPVQRTVEWSTTSLCQ